MIGQLKIRVPIPFGTLGEASAKVKSSTTPQVGEILINHISKVLSTAKYLASKMLTQLAQEAISLVMLNKAA